MFDTNVFHSKDRNVHVRIIVLSLLTASLSFAVAADAIEKDTRALSAKSRIVGSPGHAEAHAYLSNALSRIPNITVIRQGFTTVMPETHATVTLTRNNRTSTYPLYPVWPSGPRLNTTAADGLSGKAVHIGEGRYDEIPAGDIRGAVGIIESTSSRGRGDWRAAANFGAKALIFLPTTNNIYPGIRDTVLPAPIDFPRFFADDAALVKELRSGGEISIRSAGTWRSARAENVYAVIPAKAGSKEKKALVIAVQFDGMSAVPGKAFGADVAVDTAFALSYVRRLAQDLPPRPVVIAFIDAFAMNQRGINEMLAAFTIVDDRTKQKYDQGDKALLAQYQRMGDLARELDAAPGKIRAVRYEAVRKYIDGEVSKEVLIIDADLYELRAEKFARTFTNEAALVQRIDTLVAKRNEFYTARKEIFDGRLAGGGTVLARELWRRCRERIDAQIREAEAAIAVTAQRTAIREELCTAFGLAKKEIPVSFLIGLDISDASTALGILSRCEQLTYDSTKHESVFRQWLMKLEKDELAALIPQRLKPALDISMIRSLDHYTSYTPHQTVMLTSPAESFGLPAVTLASSEGVRERVDTPYDTADRLDWSRIRPQTEVAAILFDRIIYKTDFAPKKYGAPRFTRMKGVIVDQSPGEALANIPMPGFLTYYMYGRVNDGQALTGYGHTWIPGMRFTEFQITRTDGRFVFDVLPSYRPEWRTRSAHIHAYKLADDGRITRALDLKMEGKGAKMNTDLYTPTFSDMRGVVFTCKEAVAYDLYDPQIRNGLPNGSIIDARGGLEIRKQNYSVFAGYASILVEPSVTWGLIMRNGLAGNRMLLLGIDADKKNVDIEKRMRGFNSGLSDHSAALSARDYFALNADRLAKTRAAGIVSETIDGINRASRGYISNIAQAFAENDGRAYIANAGRALANEVRVYYGVRQLMDDTMRAAIFLLLALLPFSIFFERLFFSSPIIYRQILFATLIFVIMAFILWSFHPAFRLSSQTLMVVMAFGIIAVSLLVISVVYSKFKTSLDEWQSGRAEASGAKTSPAGLAVTALMLGISNMRKRKFRTVLTSVAIVLITFALVCFLSTSYYSDSARWDIPAKPVYSGVMIKRQSQWGIGGYILPYLEMIIPKDTVTAPRYWWFSASQPTWREHIKNPRTGAAIGVTAVLGLHTNESRFTPVQKLCPNWDRFAAKDGCYLPAKAAASLGVAAGETVTISGMAFTLLGTYDAKAFDEVMVDIDGQPVTPPDFSGLSAEELNAMMRMMNDPLMMMGAGDQSDFHQTTAAISSEKCIIIHSDMIGRIGRPALGSIVMQTASGHEALADDLAKRFVFPIFYAENNAVKAIVSKPLTPRVPRNILIPIIIAGLIIFNTLLSSITERRKEIYIYTSLGMAPWHIGFLFVAEAITYGLMASIFGYIIGQGAASVLTNAGLLSGITLNYSGSQTIMVMLIVMGIVIAASLIPAYLASKVAMPSTSMHWELPKAEGDMLRANMPFTVTEKTANGVMYYLYEYFDAHKEGVIGSFTTSDTAVKRIDGSFFTLTTTVWLAPYDLGIRQDVTVTVEPTADNTVYELKLAIERKSGEERGWWRLNRFFVGTLRKQLLGWRKLKKDSIIGYINCAKAAMDRA